MQKSLSDDNYKLIMRHGALEAINELSKHFQIILYTLMNEKLTRLIIELLDKEQVVFDAVYSRLKTFKKNDEFCNYNQIYIDFELMKEGEEPEKPI